MRRPRSSPIIQAMESIPTCVVCGDVLGVYEPVLVLEEGTARPSSLAREPRLADGNGTLAHRSCKPAPAGPGAHTS